MAPDTPGEPIRTAHLELIRLTARFVEAVVATDAGVAVTEVGAKVGSWLTTDPSHVIQLNLAQKAAEARGFPGFGRVIVLPLPGRPRRVIGSIGFHGPPDDRGRVEASCRIHPACRGRGYASEALVALLDWATAQYGITRFLVAIPSRRERREPVPVEISDGRSEPLEAQVDHIAARLELTIRAR